MHISLIVLWDASCFELRTTFNSVEIEVWLKIIPFFPSFLPPLYHVNFQSILVSLGRLFGRNCRPKTQKRHGVFETLDAISGSKLFHAQLKWFATIRSQKPPLFSLYQLTFLSLSSFIPLARTCFYPTPPSRLWKVYVYRFEFISVPFFFDRPSFEIADKNSQI